MYRFQALVARCLRPGLFDHPRCPGRVYYAQAQSAGTAYVNQSRGRGEEVLRILRALCCYDTALVSPRRVGLLDRDTEI